LVPFAVVVEEMERLFGVIGIPGFVEGDVGTGPEGGVGAGDEPEAGFIDGDRITMAVLGTNFINKTKPNKQTTYKS